MRMVRLYMKQATGQKQNAHSEQGLGAGVGELCAEHRCLSKGYCWVHGMMRAWVLVAF